MVPPGPHGRLRPCSHAKASEPIRSMPYSESSLRRRADVAAEQRCTPRIVCGDIRRRSRDAMPRWGMLTDLFGNGLRRRADVAAEQRCLPRIVCGDIRCRSRDAKVTMPRWGMLTDLFGNGLRRRADVAAEQRCLPRIVCGDIRRRSRDVTILGTGMDCAFE